MKLISKTTGETIATITTDHRMTIEEALYIIGAEPTSGGMDIPDYTFGDREIWIDDIELI